MRICNEKVAPDPAGENRRHTRLRALASVTNLDEQADAAY